LVGQIKVIVVSDLPASGRLGKPVIVVSDPPEGVVFPCVRSSKADQAEQGKTRVLLFPVLQSFAHTRHCRYINRRKSPSTPEIFLI